MITKVMRNDLVIPEFESFCETVTELYQKLKPNMGGNVSAQKYQNKKNLVTFKKTNLAAVTNGRDRDPCTWLGHLARAFN